MLNKKNIIIITGLLITLLTGCIEKPSINTENGTLVLNISLYQSESRFSTIKPDFDVNHYVIYFLSFNEVVSEKENLIIDTDTATVLLSPGVWDFMIHAVGAEGLTLAEIEFHDIEIVEGEQVAIDAILQPVSGTGSILISLDLSAIPDGMIISSVSYTLERGLNSPELISSGTLLEPYSVDLSCDSGVDYRLRFEITTNSDTIISEVFVYVYAGITTSDNVVIITDGFEEEIEEEYIAGHLVAKESVLRSIPVSAIEAAKENLHIAYGHTSHGSQITNGMTGLVGFMNGQSYGFDLFSWNNGGSEGALDLHDYAMAGDLGHNGDLTWAVNTRTYLNEAENSDVNVIIWSWCGGCSDNTEAGINIYLNEMTTLETEYPNITFIYMTGHLDGSGLTGNLHLRNEQIRQYCIDNNKVLYDFADIESYNPDGTYFGAKIPNDNCDYDSDGDGTRESNWAIDWQGNHIENTDWYNCSSAHSQALNANQKAYAAWWLWARLAGWDGEF